MSKFYRTFDVVHCQALVLITVELEKDLSRDHEENKSSEHAEKILKDSTILFKAVMSEDLDTLRDALRDYGKEAVLSVRNKADQTLVELARLRHKQKSLQVLTEKPNTNVRSKLYRGRY